MTRTRETLRHADGRVDVLRDETVRGEGARAAPEARLGYGGGSIHTRI